MIKHFCKFQSFLLFMGKTNLIFHYMPLYTCLCTHTQLHVSMYVSLCTYVSAHVHTEFLGMQHSAQHTSISHHFLLPSSRLNTGGLVIASIKTTTVLLL